MQTLSHKIELCVNNKQATYLAKACGVARVAYNWALSEWKRMYEAGEQPNEGLLRKKLNAIKKEKFPWMMEVTKCAPQLAIKDDLSAAFSRFFNKQSRYPKPRTRWIHDRFHISNDQFDVKNDCIRIPKLGWVNMRESLRFSGKILSATISRTANKWFASITVEVDEAKLINEGNCEQIITAGVDLGINTFATVSSNEEITKYTGVKPHKAVLGRLRRLNKSLSRKVKKSSNRKKARKKLAKLHAKVANIRNDYVEKITTELANKCSHVVLEDLNVSGMSKNRRLSRSILDMGFYNFRNRLQTKLKARNKQLTIANRWFASSKLCNNCSYLYQEMTLKDRMWVCPNCNVSHDRDANAAKNLEKLAVSSTVTHTSVEASGVVSYGGTLSNQWSTSYATLKQEFNNGVVQD